MKYTTPAVRIASSLAAIVITAIYVAGGWFANAATLNWVGTNGVTASTNWSDGANWGGAAPIASDRVLFNDFGATITPGLVDNVVDSSMTVTNIFFTQTNGCHTTLIPDGVTLTIATGSANFGVVAGTGTGQGSGINPGATLVLATNAVTGGGTLLMTNGGDLNVSQGSTGTTAHNVVLDMSGLNNLIMTNYIVNGFIAVGGGNFGTQPAQAAGTLYLAKTNYLWLKFNLRLGDVTVGNSQNGSKLFLGQTNHIWLASGAEVAVGRAGNTNLLAFNPALVNGTPPPAVYIRAPNDARMTSAYSVGGIATLLGACVGTNDYSGGLINILAGTVNIGRTAGANVFPAIGVLTFDDGTFDANTVTVGNQTVTSGGVATGIINVNSNSVLGAKGTFVVNTTLALSAVTGTLTPGTSGALNVNGGAVNANTITAGAGASAMTMTGGSLNLTNTAGTPASPIGTFGITNSTLQLTLAANRTNIASSTLNVSGTANTFKIASAPTNVYQASYPLISYATYNGVTNFAADLSILSSTYPSLAFNGSVITNNNLVLLTLTVHHAPTVTNTPTFIRSIGSPLKIPIASLATNWSNPDGNPLTVGGLSTSVNGFTVTTDGTNIFYSGANDQNDSFTYTISDGFLTGNGTVNITAVAAPPAPATANQIVTDGFGVPTITFAGIPGRTNVVEASTNLTNWTPISTNIAGTNGLWQVIDTDATNYLNRFYRSYQPYP